MEGFKVLDEDVARLSLLGHDHINMLGRYAVTLPGRVARGERRPLRDPHQLVDEAAEVPDLGRHFVSRHWFNGRVLSVALWSVAQPAGPATGDDDAVQGRRISGRFGFVALHSALRSRGIVVRHEGQSNYAAPRRIESAAHFPLRRDQIVHEHCLGGRCQ